ncbi:MAG: transposase zinc-binding domain-containing protein [Desulfobacteraceae bacterium]|nr:transposase zinc-binding domain-containing protein [Desulfobacteraceae bacterium]
MKLASFIDQYHDALQAKYGSRLLPSHLRAIRAIRQCHTPEAGELFVHCPDCQHAAWRPRSCGHRSCPQCQNYEATVWLERQQAKLLPVEYFLVTFTLPYELRSFAWNHQSLVYQLLFDGVSSTLKDFGLNPKNLGANIGMTAILHTHNRRLDYHPHIHVLCRKRSFRFEIPVALLIPRRHP